MTSKEIIAEAKNRLRHEIKAYVIHFLYVLKGVVAKEGDELDIADISYRPRFAVEEIGYFDGQPYSRGTHYIWSIQITPNGIAFCDADGREIPFEPSVEELGRIMDLCYKKNESLPY